MLRVMALNPAQHQRLQAFFTTIPELELAVLVGSRANGTAHAGSDWDFAIQWQRDLDGWTQLGKTETLRQQLAQQLDVPAHCIDLIDLPRARLAMRQVVVDSGIPLKGNGTLAWEHLLRRTWRDLEDYYWEQLYGRP